jgi:hypothetical protein
MAERFVPPPPRVVAELRELANRKLSPDEFEAYVRAPMSDEEREEMDAFIDWFMRRYPTPADRLRYARHAAANMAKTMPPSK